MEFYGAVKNRDQLASYLYKVLNSSCAKLLASKYSLSSQKKVKKKFRSDLINSALQGLPSHKSTITSSSTNLFTNTYNVQKGIKDFCPHSRQGRFFFMEIKRFSSNKAKGYPAHIKSYITGFIDGEGCFFVDISKSRTIKTGYSVNLKFQIILHSRDLELLKIIQAEFSGVGRIYENIPGRVSYQISNIKEHAILIAHLDKYPLLTRKWADYQLFREA